MVKIVVEQGIPLPRGYPFASMQIGDSFAIPESIKRTTMQVAAMRYGRAHKMKFTVRKFGDGFRCWRIA